MMRSKRMTAFLVLWLAVCLVSSFAQTKKWRQTGANTFARVKGQIPTGEVMKMLADKYAADIKVGFDQAGEGGLFLPFMDALKAAKFSDKAMPVGSTFPWMMFRVNNKVRVWHNVEWAGRKPLEVFAFEVERESKIYEFVIPRPCGNIALAGVREAKKPVPPAVCAVVVSPAKANLGEPITVDMSGTQNAASMSVEIFDALGQKVGTHAFTPAAPKWQTRFDRPGEYVFRAKAVNAEGLASTNPCGAKVFINTPPVCKLWTSCLPCEDYVGKPITFDVNGSTDVDGQVVKAVFEILDAGGAVIDTYTASQKPLTWQKVFNKPGMYTVSAVVFDDMGAASANTDPCRLSFEVTQKKFFYLAEVGGMLARGTYTGYLFGRLGMLWRLVPDALDFVLTMGPAFSLIGEPWKVVFLANALANVHLGPAVFLGAG
ncbi:MAG: hypothetical protein FJY82_15670, partial [Candidatus Aminicenantes bacterium]|nr:hypothetical protein [Candidatus Aminicenantes bacterium]